MIEQHPRIPFGLPLSPLQLLSARRPPSFPFSSRRSSFFYLARNGIWHGVESLGLEPGDQVLMPAYHHGVEIEVLKARQLDLRYYRIDEKLQLDPHEIQSLVTERTRLLYVIHYLGFPQPMPALMELARRHRLAVFEDCALSLFSASPEGPLGTHGDVSIFCLYKSLPTPQGGVMVLNNPDLAAPSNLRKPGIPSTLGYVANRLLDFQSLRGGPLGYGTSRLLRSAARTFKHTSGLTTVPIDTNEFEPEVVDLGVSSMTHHIIRRIDAQEVVRRRRANFLQMNRLTGAGVRRVVRELPRGVCPLSFPILVPDKTRVHDAMMRDGVGTVTFWSIDNPEIPRGRFPDVDFLRSHLLEVPIHQGLLPRHVEFVANLLDRHARWV